MTPQSYPIAEKALAHGKALEFSVKNQGFYTHSGRPSMHVISSIFSFYPAKKRPQSHSNDLRTPQAREVFKFSEDSDISVVKADSSDLANFSHDATLKDADWFRCHSADTRLSFDIQRESGISSGVTQSTTYAYPQAYTREFSCTSEAKALPLSWILDPTKKRPDRKVELQADKLENIYDRIAARLIQAEAHECDIWLQQDYRQSFLCVSLAAKGNKEPFLMSSAEIYGTHPDFVWFKIIANRASRLGKEYSSWYDASGMMKPDLPKKPSTYSNPEAEKFCKDRLVIPSSGQASPATAFSPPAANTRLVRLHLQERGIGPDSVPSPNSDKETA